MSAVPAFRAAVDQERARIRDTFDDDILDQAFQHPTFGPIVRMAAGTILLDLMGVHRTRPAALNDAVFAWADIITPGIVDKGIAQAEDTA